MPTNNADWIQPQSLPAKKRDRSSCLSPNYFAAPQYTIVEFLKQVDNKLDVRPIEKIILKLDSGDIDITSNYESGATIEHTKEESPNEIESSDLMLTFNNYDDTFTEFKAGTSLDGEIYHDKKLEFYAGFKLPDGTKEYNLQASMYVTELLFDSASSRVTIHCQDKIRRLIDGTINIKPAGMIPVAAAGNVGNGTVTDVAIKPFSTVAENWTLTCTTGGADGAAIFDVVGSVSGDIGDATSGTEFTTGNKVKFTISAGSTNWAINDAFTFSTVQMMEYNTVNPIKIIWSVLTGVNYDSGVNESWKTRTPEFSSDKTSGNPDLDPESFERAANKAYFNLKGYVDWDKELAELLEEISTNFLGSVYSTPEGKLAVDWNAPIFGQSNVKTFSSSNKNMEFSYNRDIANVVNYAAVRYKKRDSWDWEDVDFVYDGFFQASNSASITNYGRISKNITTRWLEANGNQAQEIANRLVNRYSQPPVIVEFETGSDAILTRITDRILLTDAKANITNQIAEVIKTEKSFSERPRTTKITVLFEEEVQWGFLGSTAIEGDGLSPQERDYDDASANDRRFAYVGTPGTVALTNTFHMTHIYNGKNLPQNESPAWTRTTSSLNINTEAVANGILSLDVTSINPGITTGSLAYRYPPQNFNGTSLEFGIIADFANLANDSTVDSFAISVSTSQSGDGYRIVIGSTEIYVNTSPGGDFTHSGMGRGIYKFVVFDTDKIYAIKDGVLLGSATHNFTGISIGWRMSIVSKFNSNVSANIEKAWVRNFGDTDLDVPNYRMF